MQVWFRDDIQSALEAAAAAAEVALSEHWAGRDAEGAAQGFQMGYAAAMLLLAQAFGMEPPADAGARQGEQVGRRS